MLRPWQRQLVLRLFARRPDGKRRHRVALVGMPRKNGKSAISSGFGLDGLFFDGQGAEVYSAAAEKEQARIVFGETKRMIEAHKELGELCRPMRDVIEVPSTHSVYRVLSAEAYSKEGLNISRNIVDELHAHPDDELLNVLLNGTGARAEPLTIIITTAGVMTDATGRDSVCYRFYKHGVDVARGIVEDPAFFFAWWGAPEGADHTDPAVWRAANPGYGDILNPEDVADAVRRMPENDFRTKRLNQWVSSAEAWLPSGAWEALASDPPVEVAPGTQVVLGFDGSRSGDSTVIIGVTVGERPHVFVAGWWERPMDAPPDWQVPAGDVKQALRELCQTYEVAEVAADAYLWQTDLEELANEGLPIVQHPQRVSLMVPATQRAYEAVLGKELTHDGDPRLARHLRNAVLRYTTAGPQLYKESKGSPRKIDGAVAFVMAFHRSFELEPQYATLITAERPEPAPLRGARGPVLLSQEDYTAKALPCGHRPVDGCTCPRRAT